MGDDHLVRAMKLWAAAGRRVQLLCLVVATLVLLGWWFDVRQPDRVGGAAAVWFVAFVLLGVLSGPVRAVRERTVWFVWSTAPQPGPEREVSIGTPSLRPARLFWLLPAALVMPMLAMLPVYFGRHPGDWTVLADVALFVVLLGYGGLALGLVLWLVVLLPMLLLARLLVTRTDGPGYERILLAGQALLGALFTIAVGIVVGKLTR